MALTPPPWDTDVLTPRPLVPGTALGGGRLGAGLAGTPLVDTTAFGMLTPPDPAVPWAARHATAAAFGDGPTDVPVLPTLKLSASKSSME